ncbi:MAG: hemolysin III family protein [Hyphomicrobiaceae bacterium]|nr:hemolysin III family protein [Hyphomicrobiaceae bacterium]
MISTRTASEIYADNVIHWIGVTTGFIAVAAMMLAALTMLPAASSLSLAIYGAAMLAMFTCSAAYHMVPAAEWKGLLRRLDHAAIFVKIAGTYTPFTAIKLGGTGGMTLLALVWAVALVGAAGKLFLTSTWDRLALPLYLALGWTGIAVFGPLSSSIGEVALGLLAAGGILYTIGVVFHLWTSLPYQNAIWHGFVLTATGCHFGAVTTAVFA